MILFVTYTDIILKNNCIYKQKRNNIAIELLNIYMSVTAEQFKQDMQKARQQAKEAEANVLKAQSEQERINKELSEAEALLNLDIELKKIAERNTLADKLRHEQNRINNQSPEEKLKIAERIHFLELLQLTNELVRIAERELKGLELENFSITDKLLKADQHLNELLSEQNKLKNELK